MNNDLPEWWPSKRPYIITDALTGLKPIPDEVINCCITSPPYFGKRDYGTKPLIWDGDPDCKHDFDMKTITVKSTKNKDFNERSGNASGDRKQETSQQLEITSGFCSKCNSWSGELGHEPHPDLYIKHLCDIFDEVKRVLRPTGTCWVNLGDSYGGSGGSVGHTSETENLGRKTAEYGAFPSGANTPNLLPKSLLMIPARFAIEMINRGWTIRNKIIWHKPACIPEPFDDRFTVDYEEVFFFVKSVDTKYWINKRNKKLVTSKPKPDYRYIDLLEDEEYRKKPEEFTKEKIPCPQCGATGSIGTMFGEKKCDLCEGKRKIKRWKRVNLWGGRDYWFEQQYEEFTMKPQSRPKGHKRRRPGMEMKEHVWEGTIRTEKGFDGNEIGRHKRTVWTINPGGFPDAHFAVFPNALIEPMIRAGCPKWTCGTCGQPKERIYAYSGGRDWRKDQIIQKGIVGEIAGDGGNKRGQSSKPFNDTRDRRFKGWSSCDCEENLVSGTLLDPFAGSGTTLEEARKLGRQGLGFEIQADYEKFLIKRSKCDIPMIDQEWN